MDLSVTVARIGLATVIWTLVDIMTAERFLSNYSTVVFTLFTLYNIIDESRL